MKRLSLLVLILALVPVGPAWGQTAPAPPVPPEPPKAAQSARPDPNVRRHRMGEPGQLLNTDEATREALRESRKALEAALEQLEAQLDRLDDPETRAELERLEAELEKLDSLEDIESLKLPPVVVMDPDRPGRVLWNYDGSDAVIVHPHRSPVKTRGEKVAYFKPLYIGHEDWIDGPAVAILGNVHVIGHVEEDVVSVGGNVTVDGTVSGNVVAPFGDVHIGATGYVEGDVVGVEVTYDDAGSIGGTIEELPLFRIPWMDEGPQALLLLFAATAVTKIIFSLLFGWLALALAPAHVLRVSERLRQKPVASFFGGVLVQILILPVFVILLVTVVGIPLAILALPLVILVGVLLGFVACSRLVGETLLGRDAGRPDVVVFATGALVLFAPLALASMLTIGRNELGDTVLLVTNLLFFVGICLLYIVYTAGLGAAIFSRLGTRALKSVPKVGSSDPLQPIRTALPQAPPATDLSHNS